MKDAIFGFDISKRWDYENGYYITSDPTRLAKALSHFELYKRILNLPGQVVECGVYKGASFLRFATYREVLESPYSRRLIGFDAFGRFPRDATGADGDFIERFEREGGEGIPATDLESAMSLKHFTNFELVEGNILETLPLYLSRHPELKIALLHLDVDVYAASAAALAQLYPHVVSKGLILFDDFGSVAGETQAVDEFLVGEGYSVEKLPLSHSPAFVTKR